jgi:hypothetical protein
MTTQFRLLPNIRMHTARLPPPYERINVIAHCNLLFLVPVIYQIHSQIFKHLMTLYVCHVHALKNVLYLHDKTTNTKFNHVLYSSPTYKNVWQHQVVLSYIFTQLFYIDCILVIQHPDDGHRSDRNMLLKNNNTWLNMFIKVHFFVYHIL